VRTSWLVKLSTVSFRLSTSSEKPRLALRQFPAEVFVGAGSGDAAARTQINVVLNWFEALKRRMPPGKSTPP